MRASATRLTALAGGLAVLALPLAASAATKVKPVIVRDTADDGPTDGIDVTRLQLGLADDGRLRAAITTADELDPADMAADSGPPGSVCLRLWTITRPVGIPPDFLVCITADKAGEKLTAVISREQVDAQPKRIGTATLSKASARTLVVKFGRSTVGSPKTIQFAAEATRPGCTRTSCVDTVPDAPKTATLKLPS